MEETIGSHSLAIEHDSGLIDTTGHHELLLSRVNVNGEDARSGRLVVRVRGDVLEGLDVILLGQRGSLSLDFNKRNPTQYPNR